MKKTKNVVIFISIAILVTIAAYYITSKAMGSNTSNNEVNKISQNIKKKNEIVENEIENNVNQNVEPSIEVSAVENKNTLTNPTPTPTATPTLKQEANENSEIIKVSDKDKAIEIAKKEWGDTNGVKFEAIPGNGGVYKIKVIDLNSPNANVVEFYTVNPKTGELSYD